jgi:hypothetical protein
MLHQLTESSPFERPLGYVALMLVAVTEQPGFPNRTTWQRRGQEVGQATATPKAILIDWFESQGVQRYFTSGSLIFIYHWKTFVALHSRLCHRVKSAYSFIAVHRY